MTEASIRAGLFHRLRSIDLKLATGDRTRGDSIDRLRRALNEYQIAGIQTNISFFLEMLDDPDFRQGNFDTGFIDRWRKTRNTDHKLSLVDRDIAVIAAALFQTPKGHPQRRPRIPDERESLESGGTGQCVEDAMRFGATI